MKNNYLYLLFLSALFSLFGVSFTACTFADRETVAQTNTTAETRIATQQRDYELLKLFGNNPCAFEEISAKGPEYDKYYELVNAGYPKPVSLDEAVAVFNKMSLCHETGKTQPPLRPEEIIGAIAVWNCSEVPAASGQPPVDKAVCREFKDVVKTKKLPKGAWINSFEGCTVCEDYNTEVWEIKLYLRLDKNRRDTKGAPEFSHLIRFNIVSAKPITN